MSKHINPFENWSLEDKKVFVQNEVEARQEYFDEIEIRPKKHS